MTSSTTSGAAPRSTSTIAVPGSSVYKVRTTSRDIVLTYDDGPEPGGTERILAALADHRATATFFVLLTRVRRHPRLLGAVVAGGHEIGLHGVDHRRLPGVAPARVERMVRDARAELEDVLGREVKWFRAPYGAHSLQTWQAVARTGLTSVLWSYSLRDWLNIPTAGHLEAALKNAAPGAITLAHDGFAGIQDGVDDGPGPGPDLDRGELTRQLLKIYEEKGLTGRSLSAALVSGEAVSKLRLTHR
ncbi:polysaccharide deacetylase family protein [Streptosporangium sandarakinum]|uniref:polysaccharide deacetylase family protein n=1 Tax=Streptosporangium sandarakinum TaxID=1260955 RepID=UPI00343850A4